MNDNVKVIMNVHLPGVIYLTGSGNVKRTYEYVECLEGNCFKVRVPSDRRYITTKNSPFQRFTIRQEQYNYYISDASKPTGKFLSNRLKRVEKNWDRMRSKQRLEFHLGELADKRTFDYRVIN